MNSNNYQKKLLIVTHRLPQKATGGIEQYQSQLPSIVGFDTYFLIPHKRGTVNVFTVRTPEAQEMQFDIDDHTITPANNVDAKEQLFGIVLKHFSFDLIHFQHLLWLPLSLPLIAETYNIPTVFTLHDHYLICSRFNLIGSNGHFCDTYNQSITQCDMCLKTTKNLPFGTQAKRRAFIQKVLNSFSAIVSSSRYLKSGILNVYPDTDGTKIHIIEMLLPNDYAPRQIQSLEQATALKIAIPGNFTSVKGAKAIIQLMECLKEDRRFSFTVMGTIQEQKIAEKCKAASLPNTRFLNGYESKDAIEILARHDVSLHLTVCPESYMITLSEAWAAGIVPIVTKLGAPADRVTNGKNGFIVDPHAPWEVYDILKNLLEGKKLAEMKKVARQQKIMTKKQHLRELASLYTTLVP